MNKYIIDTSAYIDMDRGAPVKMFPTTLWGKIGEAIENGDIVVIKAIYEEVMRSSDELTKWFKQYSEQVYDHFIDTELMKDAKEIVNKYPTIIDPKHIIDQADPYIIAYAKRNGCCLVTDERWKENKINIPSICRDYSIKCIQYREFYEDTSWIF